MIDDPVLWDDTPTKRDEYATSNRTTDGYVWSNLYSEVHDMMMGKYISLCALSTMEEAAYI